MKEKFLKNNVVFMTTDELVKLQSKIKVFSDDFNAYYADWKGAKVRFVNLTKTLTSSAAAPVHIEVTQAEATAQQTKEHASIADENQAAEDNVSSKADDSIPATEEIPRAPTSAAPEENEEVWATASVVPEETAPNSSAPAVPTPTPILPSASDAKKTKAAERVAVKKRKASTPSDSSAPKKMKSMTSSFANPIDAVPVSSMPSKDLVPFDEEYVIPSRSDEDTPSAATSEQMDE